MRTLTSFFILLLTALPLLTVQSHAHCGQHQYVQNQKQIKNSKPSARKSSLETCTPEMYYDSVYTRKTKHFQIFYTLDGPHATLPEFIDTLEFYAEKAWDIHVSRSAMLPPLGSNTTYHYQKTVEKNLYPIEVVELDWIRNIQNIFANGGCHGCYGLTYPEEQEPQKSQLFIDNDFRYIPSYFPKMDSIRHGNVSCQYPVSTESLKNKFHDFDYSTHWNKGLRVTLIHELYHAVQLRYFDMLTYWTFWLEASASGVEEIWAPDIDDYLEYLPTMFRALGTPLNNLVEDYGAGIFYLYLYHHVDPHFDKDIWEGFKKKNEVPFEDHLAKTLDKRKIKADSIFQDFAVRLSFAGDRSRFSDSSFWIDDDQPNWPNFVFNNQETFSPQPQPLAYNFYAGGFPDLNDFQGKASAILYQGKHSTIKNVDNPYALDTLRIATVHADSVIWVFSRFGEPQYFPSKKEVSLRAYPTPWRGRGPLCFSPLPHDKEFIEIRNRRGQLILREAYQQSTHCMDESTLRSKLVPGVYRFRAGSSGKTKDMMIIY